MLSAKIWRGVPEETIFIWWVFPRAAKVIMWPKFCRRFCSSKINPCWIEHTVRSVKNQRKENLHVLLSSECITFMCVLRSFKGLRVFPLSITTERVRPFSRTAVVAKKWASFRDVKPSFRDVKPEMSPFMSWSQVWLAFPCGAEDHVA